MNIGDGEKSQRIGCVTIEGQGKHDLMTVNVYESLSEPGRIIIDVFTENTEQLKIALNDRYVFQGSEPCGMEGCNEWLSYDSNASPGWWRDSNGSTTGRTHSSAPHLHCPA